MNRTFSQYLGVAVIITAMSLGRSAGAEVTLDLPGTFRQTTDWSGHFPVHSDYTLRIVYDDAANDFVDDPDFGNYVDAVSNVEFSVPASGFSYNGPASVFNRWQIDRNHAFGAWASRLELIFPGPDSSAVSLTIEWIDHDNRVVTDDSLEHDFSRNAPFRYIWIEAGIDPTGGQFYSTAAYNFFRKTPSPAILAPVFRTRGYREMFVLGDSLSASVNDSPFGSPDLYYEGGYSNGPAWVQYLAWRLKIPYRAEQNFAQFLFPKEYGPEDFAGKPVADSLVTVWYNTGTFVAVLSGELEENNPDLERNRLGREAGQARTVLDTIDRLDFLGVRNILFLGDAYIGFAPIFADTVNTPEDEAILKNLTVELNENLQALLEEGKTLYPSVAVRYLDPNPYLESVLAAPESFGVTNATDGAIEDGSGITDHRLDGPGADYFFWTSTAPTTKVQSYLAYFVYRDVFAESAEEAAASYARLFRLNESEVGLLFGGFEQGRTYRFVRSSDPAGSSSSMDVIARSPSQVFQVAPMPENGREFFKVVEP